MAVLSEKEIIRELGKKILFYPLKPDSLRGCRFCLTASEYAYSIKYKKLLKVKDELEQSKKPELEKKYFDLPARDTVLVWTHESIFLQDCFCGSIHSRVELVSKGLGHIGTTVTPNWSGILCVALHNLMDDPVRIYVGDAREPMAYLMIHRLSSPSFTSEHIDRSARLDILKNLPGTDPIRMWIDDKDNGWMREKKEELRSLLKKSPEYEKFKRKLLFDKCKYQICDFVHDAAWMTVLATFLGAFGTVGTIHSLIKGCSLPSTNLTPSANPAIKVESPQTPNTNLGR